MSFQRDPHYIEIDDYDNDDDDDISVENIYI